MSKRDARGTKKLTAAERKEGVLSLMIRKAVIENVRAPG
jgi:hypothetical protein